MTAPQPPAAPHRRWASLAEGDREQLRQLFVDALALASAGTASTDAARVLGGLAALGTGEVPVPWTGLRLGAPQAVAALSTLIHAWDFDDTHDEAVVHTASVVVPTALAAAAIGRVGGTGVADGIVTGVQVLSRLARLTGPRPGVIRTAGLGAPAAAATAAAVWGLTDAQVEHAMALSLTSALAPGTRQAVVDGSVAKRIQPGLAAQVGLSAAALAAQGVEGPSGWLCGEFGLAPGSSARCEDLFLGDFEGRFLALKPFPACRYTHAALAAAEQVQAADPDWAGVQQVTAHLPQGPAYALVARPYADRGAPLVDAQFSLPWQLAALWVTGRYDLTTLHGGDLGRDDIARATDRITVVQDLPPSAVMSGARVDLLRTDGTTASAQAAMPGGPGQRVTRRDLGRKVASCLQVGEVEDPAAAAAALWSFADELPDLDADALQAALARCTSQSLAAPAPASP
ncbi:MmgE/PrpD family protein [Nocardioides campestrisoli]|uniref:MmgE/PrpD family protein n=1 Tax=Nocardioides campestrisoli TaxID=2736757 RepID=UPI00163D7627|nr:MmgE/PrpD family protein [Nocardioides campestrisoli]